MRIRRKGNNEGQNHNAKRETIRDDQNLCDQHRVGSLALEQDGLNVHNYG